jgi:hypothetical protein
VHSTLSTSRAKPEGGFTINSVFRHQHAFGLFELAPKFCEGFQLGSGCPSCG